MKIDFNAIDETVTPHFKGGEKEFAVKAWSDGVVKAMRGRLIPGASIGLHTHETNSETLFIVSGRGKVLYEGEYIPLLTGDCHYCKKGAAHSLINDGAEDLVFFAVVAEQ